MASVWTRVQEVAAYNLITLVIRKVEACYYGICVDQVQALEVAAYKWLTLAICCTVDMLLWDLYGLRYKTLEVAAYNLTTLAIRKVEVCFYGVY